MMLTWHSRVHTRVRPRQGFLVEASIDYWIAIMRLEDLAFGNANVNLIWQQTSLAVPFIFVLIKRSELTLQCTFHSLIRPSLIFYCIIKKCILTEFTVHFPFWTGVFVSFILCIWIFFLHSYTTVLPALHHSHCCSGLMDAALERLSCPTDWMYGHMYLL